MAEIVTLQVKIQENNTLATLTNLDELVKKLNSQTVNIKVNASGVEKIKSSLSSITTSQNTAATSTKTLTSSLDKMGESVGRMSTDFSDGVVNAKNFITSLDGMRNATVKASGSVTNAEGTFQTFSASVKNSDGTLTNYQYAVDNATGSVYKMNKGVKEAAEWHGILGDSLGNIIAKMFVWQVMGALISAPIRAFKNAISTLKEVDTQLVTIQKVTDYTKDEIDALTDSAYDLASAYGKTADSVLETAASFAKAGYTDQIEALTELTLLTENVGDVEADTATEFILAADAAWGLGGDTQKLTEIIDGLNEISNKNATDVSKMAEGITVAGSVFANAGESVQTFSALLGTTTAVTQRSGSEMARGLRTIVMNVRQIKGELDDGELIDEDSISNAAKALKEVGISTMDANGQLRLTSDVLSELAGKWDTLSANEISKVSEALAGKRQANILTALMSNWDMYEKQVSEYANAAGSALSENEIYLDSWEAKSNQLSATWTKFVSNTISSDFVKWLLDVAKSILEFSDNAGLAAVALIGLIAAFSSAKEIRKFTEIFSSLKKAILDFASAASIGEVALSSWVSVIGLAVAAISLLVMGFKQISSSMERQTEKMREATSAYETAQSELESITTELETQSQRMDELNGKEKLTYAENGELEELQAITQELLIQEDIAKRAAAEAQKKAAIEASKTIDQFSDVSVSEDEISYYRDQSSQSGDMYSNLLLEDNFSAYIAGLRDLKQAQADALKAINVGDNQEYYLQLSGEIEDYEAKLYDQISILQESRSAMQDYYDVIKDTPYDQMTSDQKKVYDSYNATTDAIKTLYLELDPAKYLDLFVTSGNDAVDKVKELGKEGKVTAKDIEELAKIFPDLVDYMDKTGDSAQDLADYFNEMETATDLADDLADSTDDLTSAIDKFNEAVSSEKSDQFKEYVDAFKKMKEAAESGYWGSNAFQGGLELFLDPSVIQEFGDDYKGLWEYIQNHGIADAFGNAESMGSAFADSIIEAAGGMADGLAEVTDETGNVIAAIHSAGDSYDWYVDTSVDGITALAKATGMSTDAIISVVRAWAMLDPSVDTTELDETEQKLTEIKATTETIPENKDTEITNTADDATKKVETYIDWLNKIDATKTTRLRVIVDQVSESNAEGTKNSKGGNALVNDEQGTGLKPELIVDNGMAYIANGGNPAIVSLNPGATVYTADETKRILRGTSASGKIPAFASGGNIPISGGSSSSGSASGASSSLEGNSDLLSEFKDWVEWYMDKAKDEADAQTDAIDDQIDALKAEHEAQQDANDLLEKQLAVEEATKDLLDAQAERTVRYYNSDTGNWEWMADQRDVQSAKEKLEEAQKTLDDYIAEQEYNAIIDALEKQKEAITAQYDALKAEWDDILASFEVPARGIAEILADMNASGVPELQSAADRVKSILNGLADFIGETINYSTPEASTSTTTSTGSKTPDKTWTPPSTLPAKPGIIKGTLYDNGGLASGKGLLAKAIEADEAVISPELTSKILSPHSTETYREFTTFLTALTSVGRSGSISGGKSIASASSITNNSGNNTYINGVKIGSDQMTQPLANVLNALGIYNNPRN